MTTLDRPGPTPINTPPDPSDPAAFCRWLGERYMLNDRDDRLLAALGEVLASTPDGALAAIPLRFGLVNETRGVLVSGASGSGKTALIRRTLRRTPLLGLWDGTGQGRAFHIRVPADATLKGLATELARATGYHVSSKLRTTDIWEIALHRLAQREITILWIDEVHHLLGGRELREALQNLKSLMQGEKAISMIISGVPTLHALVAKDDETSRRFDARVVLGPIQTEAERATLREFFERCCELARLSPPRDPHLVERLEAATHSSLGSSIEMFQKGIYRALRRGEGKLGLEDFRFLNDIKRGHIGIGPFDAEPWPDLKDRLQERGWAPG